MLRSSSLRRVQRTIVSPQQLKPKETMKVAIRSVRNPHITFNNSNERRFATKLLVNHNAISKSCIHVQDDTTIMLVGNYDCDWLEYLANTVNNTKQRFLTQAECIKVLDHLLVEEVRCWPRKEYAKDVLNRALANCVPNYVIPDSVNENLDPGYDDLLSIAECMQNFAILV